MDPAAASLPARQQPPLTLVGRIGPKTFVIISREIFDGMHARARAAHVHVTPPCSLLGRARPLPDCGQDLGDQFGPSIDQARIDLNQIRTGL